MKEAIRKLVYAIYKAVGGGTVSPELLKPTSSKWVDYSVIQRIFRAKFPEGELYISDRDRYLLCSYDDMAMFLAQDNTNRQEYKHEEYDCDDFATRLHGQFSIPGWSALAFGKMWTEKHALNLMITEDERLFFIEPQTDTIEAELAGWQGKTNRWTEI